MKSPIGRTSIEQMIDFYGEERRMNLCSNGFNSVLFTKFFAGFVACSRVNSALANMDHPGESFSGSHLRKRLNVPPSL